MAILSFLAQQLLFSSEDYIFIIQQFSKIYSLYFVARFWEARYLGYSFVVPTVLILDRSFTAPSNALNSTTRAIMESKY